MGGQRDEQPPRIVFSTQIITEAFRGRHEGNDGIIPPVLRVSEFTGSRFSSDLMVAVLERFRIVTIKVSSLIVARCRVEM